MLKHINRIALYFLGLFIITVGINLSIKSGLGISPISAFTYPLSEVLQISLGTITTCTYTIFVLIQIILLKKNFKVKNLLQVPFSIAFGFFVDMTGFMMKDLYFDHYFIQMIVLLCSLFICAVGASIYMAMDIVPNPPEGLILSICERFSWPFSKVKLYSDCFFVSLGLSICLLFIGDIIAIREGTIIAALLTGKLIGIISKLLSSSLQKIAFYGNRTSLSID